MDMRRDGYQGTKTYLNRRLQRQRFLTEESVYASNDGKSLAAVFRLYRSRRKEVVSRSVNLDGGCACDHLRAISYPAEAFWSKANVDGTWRSNER